MTQKNLRIGKREPFVKKLLLIDGITRSGKFLLANLLSGIDGIEPIQYTGLLEDIPFLERFGFVEKQTAKEILQCEIDLRCYEMLIGRNINHRVLDKSSIYNIPKYKQYLERSKIPDEDIQRAIQQYYKEKRYSFFILHETFPNIHIYFETFPKMKVISLQRNPIDLVHSWYKRGLGKRWGNDPKLFQIPFAHPKGSIPWFAYEWGDVYHRVTEMDRIILSILSLNKYTHESIRKLTLEEKKNVLFVFFEDIIERPLYMTQSLSTFLKKKPLQEMSLILQREKLPHIKKGNEKEKKLQEIRKKSSEKYYTALLTMEKAYQAERQHGVM